MTLSCGVLVKRETKSACSEDRRVRATASPVPLLMSNQHRRSTIVESRTPTVTLGIRQNGRPRSSRTALVPRLTLNGKCSHCVDHQSQVKRSPSEFNHVRSSDGTCVLSPGTTPLGSSADMCYDDSITDNDGNWYERTTYRKIPVSTCEGGRRLDRGAAHECPGLARRGWGFWIMMIVVLPSLFAGVIGWWFYKKNGFARGYVFCINFSLQRYS